MSVLIVGSIALDEIITPREHRKNLLGGSASYAAVAASYFGDASLVGIVGEDFPEEHLLLMQSRKIDLQGLQQVKGETFRWGGEYQWDMNSRETLHTELNVFQDFDPVLPENYRKTKMALLANIAPGLQHRVLDQLDAPEFVVADTMDLWINIAREDLERLLQRVNMLILNDSEARQLVNETSLIRAGKKIMAMGPEYVAIKKGEHGCLLFGKDQFFSCGAYPLEDIHDPTGAGDTFAGGVAGYLASHVQAHHGKIDFEALRRAIVYGSILASFTVESFSLDRLKAVTEQELEQRFRGFRLMSQIEVLE